MMKTFRSLLAVVLVAGLAAAAQAQDLTVTVNGDFANGGSIVWDLTGAPADAPTAILASMDDTGFSIGPFLTLDIGPQIVPVAVGPTDANGELSHTLNFPALPPSINVNSITFYSQAVSLAAGPPMFGFAVSDVESATVN
ncbi:MAG TPA: hypothetical protein ENK43_06140 [Planctomycetes bacterium]|nr:hypothetical protein [Planctomycetota bacterium]